MMKTWGLSATAACEAWGAGTHPGLVVVNLTLLEAHSVPVRLCGDLTRRL